MLDSTTARQLNRRNTIVDDKLGRVSWSSKGRAFESVCLAGDRMPLPTTDFLRNSTYDLLS